MDLYRNPFVIIWLEASSFLSRSWHISGPVELVFWCRTHPKDLFSGGINILELSPHFLGQNTCCLIPLHFPKHLWPPCFLDPTQSQGGLTPAPWSRDLGMDSGNSFLFVWSSSLLWWPRELRPLGEMDERSRNSDNIWMESLRSSWHPKWYPFLLNGSDAPVDIVFFHLMSLRGWNTDSACLWHFLGLWGWVPLLKLPFPGEPWEVPGYPGAGE